MKEAEPPDTAVDTNPIKFNASSVGGVLTPPPAGDTTLMHVVNQGHASRVVHRHNPPPRVDFSLPPRTPTQPPPIPQPLHKHHTLSAKVNTTATSKQSLQNKIGTLADDKVLEAPPNNYGTYPKINNQSKKTSRRHTKKSTRDRREQPTINKRSKETTNDQQEIKGNYLPTINKRSKETTNDQQEIKGNYQRST